MSRLDWDVQSWALILWETSISTEYVHSRANQMERESRIYLFIHFSLYSKILIEKLFIAGNWNMILIKTVNSNTQAWTWQGHGTNRCWGSQSNWLQGICCFALHQVALRDWPSESSSQKHIHCPALGWVGLSLGLSLHLLNWSLTWFSWESAQPIPR